MPNQHYKKVVLGLIIIFLIVLFAESGRALRFMGPEKTALDTIALPYLKSAEWTKHLFGKNVVEIEPGSTTDTDPTPSSTIPAFTVPAAPYHLLVIGDSFIADRYGTSLEQELETFSEASVFRHGVYSTGLSRPDYFDWNEEVVRLLDQEHPNVAVVMFGANDGQDIISKDGTKRIIYGTPAWDAEYLARVQHFLELLREKNVLTFWIGNPIARSPQYAEKMDRMNRIYQQAIAGTNHARFVSTWDLLRDESGNYTSYVANAQGQMRLARTSDGIHVTEFGASFLIDRTIEIMRKELPLSVAPPTPPATPATP